MEWFTLGFTYDDVVGAWQDWRLAQECVRAFVGEARPLADEVWEVPGDAEYIVRWYVGPGAARLLDAQKVSWRQFLLGKGGAPPAGARHPLKAV